MSYTDADGTTWERAEDAEKYWAERARHSKAKGYPVLARQHERKSRSAQPPLRGRKHHE